MKIEADAKLVMGGKGRRSKYGSSTLVPEITAVWPSWQRKTEEKEGGGEDADVEADTWDIRVEVMKGGYVENDRGPS